MHDKDFIVFKPKSDGEGGEGRKGGFAEIIKWGILIYSVLKKPALYWESSISQTTN